jgi:hypothetical protein
MSMFAKCIDMIMFAKGIEYVCKKYCYD